MKKIIGFKTTSDKDIKEYIHRHNINFNEENDLNKILGEVDVIYMTRIQKERIAFSSKILGNLF